MSVKINQPELLIELSNEQQQLLSAGQFPGGQPPTGQFPGGQPPTGQFPGGQPPTGQPSGGSQCPPYYYCGGYYYYPYTGRTGGGTGGY
ncbi:MULTISPECIES: hypothetical protein [unclassified Anabaena]|uniref:hypothetical protein n=1 Tax=unclassified Anabaena TaxID=2619674 RepID=UPI00082D24CD|nr:MULTISPECIES: hypothetical protein [unclassified Anabaena]